MLLAFVVAVLLAGATPVELPPTEDPADWEAALAMGGLAAGPVGEGAWVRLEPAADGWTLRVRDRGGALHEVPVPEPGSEQEREDIVWLAVSLLHPAGVDAPDEPAPAPTPAPPPPPKPDPEPTPVQVALRRSPEPEPEPEVLAPPPPPPSVVAAPSVDPEPVVELEVAPEPEVEVAPEPEIEVAPEPEADVAPEPEAGPEPPPVEEPGPEPPMFVPEGEPEPEPEELRIRPQAVAVAVEPWAAGRPRWFTTVGLGTDFVIGGSPTASLHLDLGFDVQGFFRLGVSGAVTSPSALLWPEGASFMYGGDFFPLVAWLSPTPKRRVLWLGAGVGVRIYQYLEPGGTSGTLANDLEGWVDEMLDDAGVDGSTVSLGPASSPGEDVSFSLRLEIQGAVRLSEWAALAPWFQVQLVALDQQDEAPGRPDVLFPLTFRGGVCFVMMRHVGRGLPRLPRSR